MRPLVRVAVSGGFVGVLIVSACSGNEFQSKTGDVVGSGDGAVRADGGGSGGNGSGGRTSGSGGRASGGRSGSGGTTASGNGGKTASGGNGSGSGGSGGTGASGGSGGSDEAGGSSGTAGSGTADASAPDSGSPVSCNDASQCPSPATVCQAAVCIGHQCGYAAVPSASPPGDAVGNCKKRVCTQNGAETTVVDPTDSSDGNECTTDACDNGEAKHTPSVGAQCTKGICSAAGSCVQCAIDANCPQGNGSPCAAQKCVQGTCQFPGAGTFCNGFADQCDGHGNCVDCVNSGGCDECCVCSNGVCVPA